MLLVIALATPVHSASMGEDRSNSYSAACPDCRSSSNGDGTCDFCLPPIMGLGNTSCKQWTAHRQANNPESNAYAEWLFGFVSGYNVFAPYPYKSLYPSYEKQNMLDAVDRNCVDSPDQSIAAITVNFLRTMQASNQQAARSHISPDVSFQFQIRPEELLKLHDLLSSFAESHKLRVDYSSIKIPPTNRRDLFYMTLNRSGLYGVVSNPQSEDLMQVEFYEKNPDAESILIPSKLRGMLQSEWSIHESTPR